MLVRAKRITRAIFRSMSTPGGSVFAMTVADTSHDECKEIISLWKRENTKKKIYGDPIISLYGCAEGENIKKWKHIFQESHVKRKLPSLLKT